MGKPTERHLLRQQCCKLLCRCIVGVELQHCKGYGKRVWRRRSVTSEVDGHDMRRRRPVVLVRHHVREQLVGAPVTARGSPVLACSSASAYFLAFKADTIACWDCEGPERRGPWRGGVLGVSSPQAQQ